MYILDELMSPLITPFILYFSLRAQAPQIVDFLRNFTIDVSGVGDVCSFAEMNIKKHGNSEVWRTATALMEVFWHSIRYLFISLISQTIPFVHNIAPF